MRCASRIITVFWCAFAFVISLTSRLPIVIQYDLCLCPMIAAGEDRVRHHTEGYLTTVI